MGSTQSSAKSGTSSSTTPLPSSSPSLSPSPSSSSSGSKDSVRCYLPRPCISRFFEKLRGQLKQHFRLRSRKRHCGFKRNYGPRAALLRPMPRCSSFGSSGTLVTPAKPCPKKMVTPIDTHYAQWKFMFEQRLETPPKQRPHDISEALTGQTTPRGFPSHTDTRRFPMPTEEPIIYDCVDGVKVRRRLSFRLPSSHQGTVRRLSARQKAEQDRLAAELQRELYDLQDYYGGFHFALVNERRI